MGSAFAIAVKAIKKAVRRLNMICKEASRI